MSGASKKTTRTSGAVRKVGSGVRSRAGTRKGTQVPPSNNGEPATVRGRRTLADLVTSAREIFERDGFVDARITDIVENAGVAYGSFYTYFDSKEAIFREVALSVAQDMYETSYRSVDSAEHSTAFTRLREANRRYIEAYANNAKIFAVIHQMATRDAFTRDLWQEIRSSFIDRAARGLRRLQERGHARADIDPALTANLLGGMAEHFAYLTFALGDGLPRPEQERIVDAMTVLWAGAIGLQED